MSDITDFTTWSSTASSNFPTGTTSIGTGLDDNLRQIQAEVAKWRDGTGYGVLTLTGVAGSNSITGTTSPAPTLAANQKYLLVPAGTNTGAVVLNVNSAGNKSVYAGNSAMVGGELHANIPILVEYDGTQFQALGPVFKQPTSQSFTSGSGTYTTPTGATRIRVRLVGGGAGGVGGTAGGAGNAGANTTFSTLTGTGGSAVASTSVAGAGGAAAGGDINIPGGSGGSGVQNAVAGILTPGGAGGNSALGGGGAGGAPGSNNGGAGATNSGAGGGGGGGTSANNSGGGGGAGGYVEKLFTAPSATYSYGVGAGGAGVAGSVSTGGTGAAGIIFVDEFYD